MKLSTHRRHFSASEISSECAPAPFSQIVATLTQEEPIELKWQANYWRSQYQQLTERSEELRNEWALKLEQADAKNRDLQQDLDLADAKNRDFKKRLYGKKSEKGTTKKAVLSNNTTTFNRPRGQQKGHQSHGRHSEA